MNFWIWIITWFWNVFKARKKVVHKNISQGFNYVRRSWSKIITKLFHNIKVTFQVCLHHISFHKNLHQNVLNDFAIKVVLYDFWWPLCLLIMLAFWPFVTFQVILHFMIYSCLFNVSIHWNFYKNHLINECARKEKDKIP